MKHSWINNNGSSSVILVFLGWGADARCLSRMEPTAFDVVAFYDYDDLHTSVDLSCYTDIQVIAWSMGVFNAECFLNENHITPSRKVAIAGTCLPVDNLYGLLPDICQGTLDNWADTTRRKFSMRMCGGRQGFADALPLMSDRSVDNQKTELSSIMLRAKQLPSGNDVTWNKAIISSADLIFLPDNQRRYWQSHATAIVEVDMPHFPFLAFSSFDAILQ